MSGRGADVGVRAGAMAVYIPLSSRPDWFDRAACVGLPIAAFFGAGDRALTAPRLARARAICRDCAARCECFAYAVADPDLHGLWAGTTRRDRQRIRARSRSQQLRATARP